MMYINNNLVTFTSSLGSLHSFVRKDVNINIKMLPLMNHAGYMKVAIIAEKNNIIR